MLDDLSGKVALVTGGSRGIGREIALALANAGVDVAVNYHTREEEAQEVCGQIKEMGRRAIPVKADVSDSAQVDRMIAAVREQLGEINILVNNAGMIRPESYEEVSEQSWDEILDVNLKSVFLMTKAVAGEMRSQRWGRIINISSVAGQMGSVSGPHYAAAKAGILGLTRYFSLALAQDGITVNAIAPALIETDMLELLAGIRPEMVPVGRYGSAEEVAAAAIMLARNGYITGQTINVNGGRYMV
ncbi:MAG: 3-oxoacyl-ACP reductase FabG [Chloroflexi bacterium]|nr:3-oxoacyl-ACP reductase FabG [Chloroflexota bacterium]